MEKRGTIASKGIDNDEMSETCVGPIEEADRVVYHGICRAAVG